MGKRGPRPKPTRLRVVEGNQSKRPLPKSEPKPKAASSVPRAPSWLPEEGKREWRVLAGHLHRMGLLTVVDLTALSMYCLTVADIKRAESFIRENGETGLNLKTGLTQKRPEVAIKQRAVAQLPKYLAMFGLSPADRVALAGLGKSDEEDDFDRLVNS